MNKKWFLDEEDLRLSKLKLDDESSETEDEEVDYYVGIFIQWLQVLVILFICLCVDGIWYYKH